MNQIPRFHRAEPDGVSEFRWLDASECAASTSLRWSTHPPGVIPLDVGELGCQISAGVRTALYRAIDEDDVGYAPLARRSQLPDAVQVFLEREYAWTVPRSVVVPIANTLWGVASCLIEAGVKGRIVAIGPLYPGLREAIEAVGCNIEQVDLIVEGVSSARLDLGQVEHALVLGASALVLTYPHSPTGYLFSADDLAELVSILERRSVPVVVDEVYGPLVFEPTGYEPLAKAVAGRCQVYSVGSVSKAWNLASLKAGWIVCPSPSASANMQRMPTHVLGQLGAIATRCAAAALTDQGPWLHAARAALALNSRSWVDQISSDCRDVKMYKPQAGMYVWMTVPDYTGSVPLSQAILRSGKVAVGSGSAYGQGFHTCVRVNIAAEPDVLAEAALRVIRTLELL